MLHAELGDRKVIPSPDDSYHYLYHVRWLSDYGLHTSPPIVVQQRQQIALAGGAPDIRYFMSAIQPYFSWALGMSIAHSLTGRELEKLFVDSFYFGTCILALVLFFFAWSAGLSAAPWLMLALVGFFGGGSYHGFFWVVPSFYSLCLYLLLLNCMALRKPGINLLPMLGIWLATPLLFFVHPSGWMLVLCLLGCTAFGWATEKGRLASMSHLKILCAFALPLLATALFYVVARIFSWIPPTLFTIEMMTTGLSANQPGGGRIQLTDFAKLGAGIVALLPGYWGLRSRAGRVLGIQVLCFFVLTLLLIFSGSPTPKRFYLFLVPLGYLFTAFGSTRLYRWLRMRRRFALHGVFGAIMITLTLFLMLRSLHLHRNFGKERNVFFNSAGLRAKMAQLPSNSLIIHNELFPLHYLSVVTNLNWQSWNSELLGNESVPVNGRPVFIFCELRPNCDADPPKGMHVSDELFSDSTWSLKRVVPD